jgi:hypothetical protein
MTSTPSDNFRDDVSEADWADQHASAEPEADELLAEGQPTPRSVTTEADTADLAEQDTVAYVADDEV